MFSLRQAANRKQKKLYSSELSFCPRVSFLHRSRIPSHGLHFCSRQCKLCHVMYIFLQMCRLGRSRYDRSSGLIKKSWNDHMRRHVILQTHLLDTFLHTRGQELHVALMRIGHVDCAVLRRPLSDHLIEPARFGKILHEMGSHTAKPPELTQQLLVEVRDTNTGHSTCFI